MKTALIVNKVVLDKRKNLARICSFDDRSYNQCLWDKKFKEYTAQIKKLGATTLMTNYLSNKSSGGYFGGAAVISKSGKILNSLPLGREGILLADL